MYAFSRLDFNSANFSGSANDMFHRSLLVCVKHMDQSVERLNHRRVQAFILASLKHYQLIPIFVVFVNSYIHPIATPRMPHSFFVSILNFDIESKIRLRSNSAVTMIRTRDTSQ